MRLEKKKRFIFNYYFCPLECAVTPKVVCALTELRLGIFLLQSEHTCSVKDAVMN